MHGRKDGNMDGTKVVLSVDRLTFMTKRTHILSLTCLLLVLCYLARDFATTSEASNECLAQS